MFHFAARLGLGPTIWLGGARQSMTTARGRGTVVSLDDLKHDIAGLALGLDVAGGVDDLVQLVDAVQ